MSRPKTKQTANANFAGGRRHAAARTPISDVSLRWESSGYVWCRRAGENSQSSAVSTTPSYHTEMASIEGSVLLSSKAQPVRRAVTAMNGMSGLLFNK